MFCSSLVAQNLGSLALASSDASLLSQNYLNPAIQGMMSDMNAGWYSSAKIHKSFGFDITIVANLSLVPDSGKYFNFNPSDYTYLSTRNGETQLETVMGELEKEIEGDCVLLEIINRAVSICLEVWQVTCQ